MPYRKRKKPLRGIGQVVGAMCPIRPNVVWAMDFQFDQTCDGRMLKFLNVVDEFTREALATDGERSIDADGVVRCLERLAAERGAPAHVRFDHGPEFIAYAVDEWCRHNGTDTVFIDPGSPWQNAWIESFNGRMRDEHLNGQQFDSLLEAKVLTEDWRTDYNINTPHSAHGWLTRSSSSRPGSTDRNTNSHGGWLKYRGPVTITRVIIRPTVSQSTRQSLQMAVLSIWVARKPTRSSKSRVWCEPGPREGDGLCQYPVERAGEAPELSGHLEAPDPEVEVPLARGDRAGVVTGSGLVLAVGTAKAPAPERHGDNDGVLREDHLADMDTGQSEKTRECSGDAHGETSFVRLP